jgi:AraC-like DNA-binding protein
MATVVTPLREDRTLDRLRDLVLRLAPEEGHRSVEGPDMCIYRFAAPTTVRKAATFGVTLGVVLQGTKRLLLDGHELTVDPSRLLVITRETEHESVVSMDGRGRPYLGLSICFSPERVARALLSLAQAGVSETPETVPAFVTGCDVPLASALERLVMTLDDPLERKLLAPLALEEILFRLLRSDAAAAVRSGIPHAVDAGRILESMQFIRANHTEKLSVERLARRAAMSPSHYAHRFTAVARVSPMRYLREVRLENARSLLVADGARAGDVARDVGFESPAHFAREFKRRFGVSPSRYAFRGTPAGR